LDDANSGMAVTVNVSLVALGKTEEAFQFKVVVGQVRLLAADEQAGEKAGHDFAHVLPGRIGTGLKLVTQVFKTGLAFRSGAVAGIESRVNLRHIGYLLANDVLGFLDGGQAAVDAVS
jgi:hypothetical protein